MTARKFISQQQSTIDLMKKRAASNTSKSFFGEIGCTSNRINAELIFAGENIYFRMGKLRQAIADFTTAIRLDLHTAGRTYRVGVVR